jgi:hypothetical protein
VKLTEVMAVWEHLHVRDTGDIGFCDLDRAIDAVVGVENDVPMQCPQAPRNTHFKEN